MFDFKFDEEDSIKLSEKDITCSHSHSILHALISHRFHNRQKRSLIMDKKMQLIDKQLSSAPSKDDPTILEHSINLLQHHL